MIMLAEQLSHSTSATRKPEPGQPHHSAEPSNQNVPLKHLVASHSMLRQTVSIVSRLKFRKTLAFMLRSSLSPRLTLRWLRFLGEYTEQHTFAPPHDDLIRKSLSSFLVHRMAWKTRLNILTQHFELARQLLCPHVLQALWRGEKLELGTICGRERAYRLQLLLSDHCGSRHEGVFTVRLVDATDDALLCMASFVFVCRPGQSYSLIVGGLQGSARADAKRAVISATRDLGGLRPKDAIMLVLKGLIAHGATSYLIAVSNSNHVINHRTSKRRKRKLPDLDAYWLDRGGVPFPPFGFRIPADPAINDGCGSRRSNTKIAFWKIGANLITRKGNN
ncbi:DUF535 family protein [Brucella intermedia]|jgi:uncharacterized protein VirK/YbjX|uniref:DUF535 family protein n=2 Tax=Brucella intermedia TaxID=94625 RepID=UPI00224AF4AE|nr:DUF535 family protein [Brucella intermedia]